MKKKTRPTRPTDPNMRMASILSDVVAISNRPIKAPAKKPRKTR